MITESGGLFLEGDRSTWFFVLTHGEDTLLASNVCVRSSNRPDRLTETRTLSGEVGTGV